MHEATRSRVAVAVAAATSAKPVKACVNSKHVLSLFSKGKCKAGAHKVSIGVKGPRGTPGPPGVSTAYATHVLGTTGNFLAVSTTTRS